MNPFKGALVDPSQFEVTRLPLYTNPERSEDRIPRVVNVVSTVYLLPLDIDPVTKKRKYHIPLQTIAAYLPVAQYIHKAFPSVIMRLKDGDSLITMLLFSSGKCVFVKCDSPFHSLYISQQVRLMLSEIPVIYEDSETKVVKHDKLGKFIQFSEWRVQNVVLSIELGFRIKLEELAMYAPDRIKYTPGGFPGAECEVAVRETCRCTRRIKCGCTATVLIFDSGSIIIAGTKTIQDGNSVYHRIESVIKDFEDEGMEMEKKDRNRTRIKKLAEILASKHMLVAEQPSVSSMVDLTRDEEEEALEQAIQATLDTLCILKTKDPGYIYPKTSSPFFIAVQQNQVENVKFIIENQLADPNEVKETIQRLKDELKANDPMLVYLLKYVT